MHLFDEPTPVGDVTVPVSEGVEGFEDGGVGELTGGASGSAAAGSGGADGDGHGNGVAGGAGGTNGAGGTEASAGVDTDTVSVSTDAAGATHVPK